MIAWTGAGPGASEELACPRACRTCLRRPCRWRRAHVGSGRLLGRI